MTSRVNNNSHGCGQQQEPVTKEEVTPSTAATAATPTAAAKTKRASKKQDAPRTVTTLMRGRGYLNWRRATLEKKGGMGHSQAAAAAINNSDAFLVIWEMKL